MTKGDNVEYIVIDVKNVKDGADYRSEAEE
jgi:hypothetical protein